MTWTDAGSAMQWPEATSESCAYTIGHPIGRSPGKWVQYLPPTCTL